jgi:hypothetical protein
VAGYDDLTRRQRDLLAQLQVDTLTGGGPALLDALDVANAAAVDKAAVGEFLAGPAGRARYLTEPHLAADRALLLDAAAACETGAAELTAEVARGAPRAAAAAAGARAYAEHLRTLAAQPGPVPSETLAEADVMAFAATWNGVVPAATVRAGRPDLTEPLAGLVRQGRLEPVATGDGAVYRLTAGPTPTDADDTTDTDSP